MDTEIWIVHYGVEDIAFHTWETASAYLWFLWGQIYSDDADMQMICREEYGGNVLKMIADFIETNDSDTLWYSTAILKE